MFYNQPLSIRFGTEFRRHVGDLAGVEPYWDTLDVAVAWVRASGMTHLTDSLETFLSHGGRLSVIVGIDLQNTTREGLEALLALEQFGAAETFVYHNESGSVFHPKMYLFRNEEEARLIVGSNNLTQAGLYVNVEAGLQVDTQPTAAIISQALDALSSWKDTSTDLAVRLTPEFLAEMVRQGYVPDEARARAELSRERARRAGNRQRRLFGSRTFTAPPATRAPARVRTRANTAPRPRPATPHVPAPSAPQSPLPGTVLLMRLRKASVTDRPTQTQIPFRVADTFFRNVGLVRSAHSGQRHQISEASARGARNTIKLEIPEMRHFGEPLARFERTPQGIVYEVHDAGSPSGNQILLSLEEGRRNGTTQMTVSDAQRATWWRFI